MWKRMYIWYCLSTGHARAINFVDMTRVRLCYGLLRWSKWESCIQWNALYYLFLRDFRKKTKVVTAAHNFLWNTQCEVRRICVGPTVWCNSGKRAFHWYQRKQPWNLAEHLPGIRATLVIFRNLRMNPATCTAIPVTYKSLQFHRKLVP